MSINFPKSTNKMPLDAKELAGAIYDYCGSRGYDAEIRTEHIDVPLYEEGEYIDFEREFGLPRQTAKRILRPEILQILEDYSLIEINKLWLSHASLMVKSRLFDAVENGFRMALGPKRVIFLCHSSSDERQALQLQNLIENCLANTRVFCSSNPEDISAGKWFDKVINELNLASFLVIIASTKSVYRPWVNFEFGYFSGKHSMENLYVAKVEDFLLPEPLQFIEAKNVHNYRGLKALLSGIADKIDTFIETEPDYEAHANALIKFNSLTSDLIEVGIVPNVVSPEFIRHESLPQHAVIQRDGEFTLLFRNNSDIPLKNIKLHITGKTETDQSMRLRGLGDKHVTPLVEFQTLETTSEWNLLKPHTLKALALRRAESVTGQDWIETGKVIIEFHDSNPELMNNRFEVSLEFLPFKKVMGLR